MPVAPYAIAVNDAIANTSDKVSDAMASSTDRVTEVMAKNSDTVAAAIARATAQALPEPVRPQVHAA